MSLVQRIMLRNLRSAAFRPQIRNYSSSEDMPRSKGPFSPVDPKIKAMQELYQADNDLPVHEKGGKWEAFSYRAMFAGAIAGTIFTWYINYYDVWVRPFQKSE